MKTKSLLLPLMALAFSYLFYKQSTGINYLLFNILLVIALGVKDGFRGRNTAWWAVAAGCLASAVGVTLHSSALAICMNLISFSLLGVLSLSPRLAVVTALFQSFYSYITSVISLISGLIERIARKEGREGQLARKALITILPIGVCLLFFLLYRAANPVFNVYAARINLDFISFSWIMFTFGGLIVVHALLYPRLIGLLERADLGAVSILQPKEEYNGWADKAIMPDTERQMGIWMMILLNLLLLCVNALDTNFLFFTHELPDGLSYADFVHQGIGVLIFSIVLAVLIILFLFRGRLNFSPQNRVILWLTTLWVLQNAFMILSTAKRNDLYIAEYGLTYKRIGVYFYLALTLAGLAFTLVKIWKRKTNWYLFRANGWAFWAVLVAGSLVGWKLLIIQYNVNLAQKQHTTPDAEYLLSLGPESLPYMAHVPVLQPGYSTFPDTSGISTWVPEKTVPMAETSYFQDDVSRFAHRQENLGWQSWNLDDAQTLLRLKNMGLIKENGESEN